MEVRVRGMGTHLIIPGELLETLQIPLDLRQYTHTLLFFQGTANHSHSLQYQTLCREGQTDLLRRSSPVQLYELVQQQ